MRAVVVCAISIVVCAPLHLVGQTIPTRRAIQVFRFGEPDAKAPYEFADAPRLVVDEKEFIYSRSPSDASVTVFGPEGQFVRRIGRKGEGPGEFLVAGGHGLVGDTLWIANWPAPRISLFRTDGTHLATRRTPVDIGQSLTAPAGLSGLLAGGRAFVLPDAAPLGLSARGRLPVLVGPPDMSNRDTVAMVPAPRGLHVPAVGSWAFAPMPLPPLVAIGSAGTSIATADWDGTNPSVVRIRLLSATGAEQFRRELKLATRPIPARVRDSLHAVALAKAAPQLEAARRRGVALPGSNERLVERGLDLPDQYPPIRNLVLGIDGTIWIEEFGDGTGGTWLVLDRRGEPSFRTRVPATFELQQASQGHVWGIDRDELGVSYLVRLRLVPQRFQPQSEF